MFTNLAILGASHCVIEIDNIGIYWDITVDISEVYWFLVDICRYAYLVGGLEHEWIMTFHSVGNFIIPTDEVIFFRGVGIPTRCVFHLYILKI